MDTKMDNTNQKITEEEIYHEMILKMGKDALQPYDDKSGFFQCLLNEYKKIGAVEIKN